MAEEKTTQTAGTVLDRLGMGSPWSANQTAIANLVRSGSLSPADVHTLTSYQLSTLGSKGYMDLYPQVFGGGAFQQSPMLSPEAMEIAALINLKNSFIGVGMEIYRTMINNRINTLEAKIAPGAGRTRPREADFPLPDWMRPILGLPPLEEDDNRGRRRPDWAKAWKRPSTISAEEAKGLKVAPLGAQTELSVDQQKYLSSFIAWQKVGAPSAAGTSTLQRMAQGQGDWWQEFQRQSQSMFPASQRLGVQRRVASQ